MPCLVFKDKQGRRIEVALDKPHVSVGRQPGNDVVIPFRSVSRQHCVFATRADGVFVSDVGSSNGSMLNDAPLQGEQRLKDRDHLTIGEFRIRFYDRSKYPTNSVSMESTRGVVLFEQEVARPATDDATGAVVAEPRRGVSGLSLVMMLGAAAAGGGVVMALIALVLLRLGVLKIG